MSALSLRLTHLTGAQEKDVISLPSNCLNTMSLVCPISITVVHMYHDSVTTYETF